MKTLVVAPHPDDELLGCGGMLLRRKREGGVVAVVLMTEISEHLGWDKCRVDSRMLEIDRVRQGLGVSSENHFRLGYPTARLDTVPMGELIAKLSFIIQQFAPEELLLPYGGDVHSDHRVAFNVGVACSKWFRYPTVRRVMTYETSSETDFCVDPDANGFKPNFFLNIEEEMSRKLDLIEIYRSEVGQFPFPRSTEAFLALARVRGAQSGFGYAEGFMILRERS